MSKIITTSYNEKRIVFSEFRLSDDAENTAVYNALSYCPDEPTENGFYRAYILSILMRSGYGIESITNPHAWEYVFSHRFMGEYNPESRRFELDLGYNPYFKKKELYGSYVEDELYTTYVENKGFFINSYGYRHIVFSEFKLLKKSNDCNIYGAFSYCLDEPIHDGYYHAYCLQIKLLPGYDIESITDSRTWKTIHTWKDYGRYNPSTEHFEQYEDMEEDVDDDD